MDDISTTNEDFAIPHDAESKEGEEAPTPPKSNSFLDRLPSTLLILLVFLLPVFFIPVPGIQLQAIKNILIILTVVVVFAVWASRRLRDGVITIPRTSLVLSMLTLPAVVLVASLASPSLQASFFGQGFEVDTFSFMAAGVLLFFLTALHFRTRGRLIAVFAALIASFAILALFQGVRVFFGPDTLTFGYFTTSISNMFGKWNDLGIFFGLIALSVLLAIEVLPLTRVVRIFASLVLALALFLLAVVNFALVWLVLGVAALGIGFWSFLSNRAVASGGEITEDTQEVSRRLLPAKKLPLTPVLVFAVSAVFLFGGSALDTRIAQTFNISHIEARPAWESTFAIAGETLAERPLLGAGPGLFSYEWLQHKPQNINESPFWSVDFNLAIGFIPTFLITTGALGTIAWALFLISFVLLCLRALRALLKSARVPDRQVRDRTGVFLILSTLAAAAYLWTFAFFYIPSSVLVGLAFIFTGLFVAVLVEEGILGVRTFSFGENSRVSFVTSLVMIVVVLGGLAGGFVVSKRFLASAYFQRSLVAVQVESNGERAEQYAIRAIRFNKKYDEPYRLLSQLHLNHLTSLLARGEFEDPATQQKLQAQLAQAILFARTATEVGELRYQNWSMLGTVYGSLVPIGVEGAYDNAVAAYEEAIRVNPTSPALFLSLARLEASNGNIEAAREYIDDALALKSNFSAAVFFLSQLEVSEGNLESAIISAEDAVAFSPTDPIAYFQLGLLQYNKGNFEGAATALENAVFIRPVYANARYFLGLSYEELGRTDEAIVQFEEVARFNPDSREVALILSNLREGNDPFEGADTFIPPIDDEPERGEELPVGDE